MLQKVKESYRKSIKRTKESRNKGTEPQKVLSRENQKLRVRRSSVVSAELLYGRPRLEENIMLRNSSARAGW
jgi:hypothetical protein